MAKKRFQVRGGYNYRVVDDKGNEKTYSEGDILELEQADGITCHQLEYADQKDRTAALQAEQQAATDKAKDQAVAQASMIAQALANLQAAISPATDGTAAS
ncbi:MAG: hypothetical protein PHY45_02480 [Rhodocyclaceae bacterium]|nr:hypothetical protein [Rhodocyclaceae bacterium]